MWDKDTGLPIPPLDAVFNGSANFWVSVVCAMIATATFAYGLKYWRENGTPVVLCIMLGALATCLFGEPCLDVAGAAWHPSTGQAGYTVFTLMGRHIPEWVVGSYLAYVGGLGTLNYLSFRKGPTMRLVLLWWLLPLLADIGQEILMMRSDLYYYYGNQPLVFCKFPLWWAATNSIGVLLGIAILTLIRPVLNGWRLLLVPVIMPVAFVVGFFAVGLPSVLAVNTAGTPRYLADLAGSVTFMLAGLMMYGIGLIVAVDSPWRTSRALLVDTGSGSLPANA